MTTEIFTALKKVGVLPVINIKNSDYEKTLMSALGHTDIKCLEVTLRSDYSMDAIKNIKKAFPDYYVGAGTVMNKYNMEKALECGADFIVSPGFDKGLVCECIKNKVPVIPGCSTPTEIMAAVNEGCTTVKFFPAELSGGISALKLYAGAFSGISFVPTGGINAQNIIEYFKCTNVLACGGSFMASEKMLMSGDIEGIVGLCNKFADVYLNERKNIQ